MLHRKLREMTVIILLVFLGSHCAAGQKKDAKAIEENKIIKKAAETVPAEKSKKMYKRPFRGLYVPNRHGNSMKYIKGLHKKGGPLGINMLVIDVQKYRFTARINSKVIAFLKERGYYIAARVVCFPNGLRRLPVSRNTLKKLYSLIGKAADAGFNEIQLDYIRFEDGGPRYRLKRKYAFIEKVLKKAREITSAKKVKLSADVFGRVVYNKNDGIGQQLEMFAKHMDVIYPMLYPSHFTADKFKLRHPGKTILDGTQRGLKRLKGKNTDIQPYIQCFRYNIQWARMSLTKYVKKQILAAEGTEARGWVAWNARGNYREVFRALRKINKRKENKEGKV